MHGPTVLILWICSYFIIFEEICIFNKSVTWKDVFKQYLSVQGLINLLAIVSAIFVTISLKISGKRKETRPLLYALTFLLVWLKLLVQLKKINKDLAQFVHICGNVSTVYIILFSQRKFTYYSVFVIFSARSLLSHFGFSLLYLLCASYLQI